MPRKMAREPQAPADQTSTAATAKGVEPTLAPQKKIEQVLALLRRSEGATLPELVAATGWLPHTTRAALTGLRKKGHAIEKARRDDVTCYRVEARA